MINKIYKEYDKLTIEQRQEIVSILSKDFNMSILGIQNNWFYNKLIRHIPTHKQEHTLKVIKEFKNL